MKRGIISGTQSALPFRGRDSRGIMAYALPWERRIIGTLGILFVILGILYIYFVTSSILHVAARQELLGKVVAAKTAVASLETRYFGKTQAITETYAHSIGFVAVAKETFVERNTALTLH